MRAWKTLAALLFVVTLALPARATAMSIPVGVVVFDTFIPGPDGTNAFFISNLTGGFALPPDFSVASPLVFDSPLLEWIGPAGSPFDFGNVGIGPGNHDPELPIQFPDTDAFVSASIRLDGSGTATGGSVISSASTLRIAKSVRASALRCLPKPRRATSHPSLAGRYCSTSQAFPGRW
jgi:hypothetical protein